jgi:hypothetical protein
MARKTRSKTSRDAFEVKLPEDRQEELVAFLDRELGFAEQARDSIVGDNARIDLAHLMYEGGDGTLTKNTPWPGASNLGSWIVTEKVGSMRARIVATLFADPPWIVEGYGDSAQRAPMVEMFHQWKADEIRLQTYLSRMTHNALIEGTGVLEVTDRVVLRKGLRRIRALLQRDAESGVTMLDEDGQPVPVRRNDGSYEEAGPDEPHLKMIVSDVKRASAGPSIRVVSLKNFFILPGHAAEREDIWGYAKRFWRRLSELKCRERDGFYQNVEELGTAGETQTSSTASSRPSPQEMRAGQDIAPQTEETAEKELWEVTFLADLDDDGYEEWYVATISRIHKKLLRVQYQDYNTPHYILFTPFPRPNSVYGFSYAFDMLGSLYDEHSAVRNMYADRMVLATSAPFLVTEGTPWQPSLRPFGPRQTIPVRDLNEIKQLEIKDVPTSIIQKETMILSAAERISGQNDISTGHMAQQDRTLGEVRLVTEQSFVRIDETVKNFQEGMEDLFDLLHLVWKYKLEESPEPAPGDILLAMAEHGIQIPDGMITADLLEGVFRGKPHGSVESADFSKMRVDFAGMMTALTQLAQAVPAVRAHLNDPTVVRSIVSQIARIYRWPDRQNLVSNFTGQPPALPPSLPPGNGASAPVTAPGAPMAGAPPNVTSPNIFNRAA